MPLYQFKNNETGEEFTKMMKYDDMKSYVEENPHITNIVGAPRIVSGVGTNVRPTDSHREVISKIKDTYKINNIRDH